MSTAESEEAKFYEGMRGPVRKSTQEMVDEILNPRAVIRAEIERIYEMEQQRLQPQEPNPEDVLKSMQAEVDEARKAMKAEMNEELKAEQGAMDAELKALEEQDTAS